MIRHMLCWNLTPAVKDRLAVLEAIKVSFREMVEKIDGLSRAEVDADLGFGTHDLGLYCEFDSWTALDNYMTHPLHMAFRERMKDCLTDRVCVDLEAQG